MNTYNIRIESFPDMFVARMMTLTPEVMFKVTEQDRQDVELNHPRLKARGSLAETC